MNFLYIFIFILVILTDFLIGYYLVIPLIKKALENLRGASIVLSSSRKLLLATIWTLLGFGLTLIGW